MATYAVQIPSGSTNGRMVKVATTATPGTLIHTAHATAVDEIYIWAVNTDTTARKLTVEFGGTTAPDDLIEMTIQPECGPVLVVDGVRVTGGVAIRAFAATANVINILSNVNRIT